MLFSFKSLKELLKLSAPIIFGQLGLMLIGTGDVYIAGLYSTQAVAAIGVANGIINPVFLFGVGLSMGVSTILSIERPKVIGASKQSIVGNKSDLFNILSYGLSSGIILSVITYLLSFFIDVFTIDSALIPGIQQYIRIVCWSFPFAYLHLGIKEYLQAREEVFIPNLLSIIAVFVNIMVNAFLVFGVGNFKGIGEIGLAWASLIIRILLFLSLLFVVRKEISLKLDLDFQKRVFKFSLPIAFMFFLEVLAFCSVSVLSGFFGVESAAANNIIMNLASIVFMVPLSIASAVAVKIGAVYGKTQKKTTLDYSMCALLFTLIFNIISATLFYLYPEELLKYFSHDKAVIELGAKILVVVVIFQLFDGIQVTLGGILRGLDKTKFTSTVVFIGYWLLGIPIGLFLAFKRDLEVYGLWVGLAISLATVALILGGGFINIYRKAPEYTEI